MSAPRFELAGAGGRVERRWTSVGAAAALIGNGPPVVSACRPDGVWSVIFNAADELAAFPTVPALAAELDRRRRELTAP